MVDAKKEIKMKIKGYYTQNGTEHKMDLDKLHVFSNGEIKTSGSDSVGDFSINGHFHSDGSVKFEKQYVGKHCVHYEGKLDGREIKGTWSLGGLSDSFRIRIRAKVYEGYYEQSGSKHNLTCYFKFDDDEAFGIGFDSIGASVWSGGLDGDKAYLNKHYVGKHDVSYKGKLGFDTFEGTWAVGSATGSFHFKKSKK